MPQYKILYMASPEFALPAYHYCRHNHHILAVYSQPPRPSGRGMQLRNTPVAEQAINDNITLHTPTHFTPEQIEIFTEYKADLAVVVGYGLLLPRAILTAPRWGCWNIHASLLPRWRGAAPIERAIEAGDTHTGLTIQQMIQKLDAGDILAHHSMEIGNENSQSLRHILSQKSAELLAKTMAHIGHLQPVAQDETQANYAHKITKDECRLNPADSGDILAKIRAFQGWGVSIKINEIYYKIQSAGPAPEILCPIGMVKGDKEKIYIGTSMGTIYTNQLQPPGKNQMNAQQFMHYFLQK